MPLKIQLKPKERVIINGAVIEGAAESRTEIVVLNNASVMRSKHILQQEGANTPVKRLYFQLQMMYIDEEHRQSYEKDYATYLKDLDDTFTLPMIKDTLALVRDAVDGGRFYDAMKLARELIKVESELLKIANPMED